MPSKKTEASASVEHKYIIPGLGKYPAYAKPTVESPFPGQFLNALFRIPAFYDKPIPSSFTNIWRKEWLSISGVWSEDSSRKCSEFFDGDGLCALEKLAKRDCNPNLVMSLLSQYLWDESNPDQEQDDPNVKSHLQDVDAVRKTRMLFRNHTWERTAETQLVEKALQGLEKIAQSYVDAFDFRTGRGLQNDKQNRVMFAVSEHLKKKGVKPNWRLMLDMFVAAGAISFNGANDNPDRRIKPRLKSFEKDHPREAAMMPDFVSDWPTTMRVPFIFRLPPEE